MTKRLFFPWTALLLFQHADAFVGNNHNQNPFLLLSHRLANIERATAKVYSNRRLEDEIEANSRRKAQGGVGETVAGAVLGGLLLGPFGALFGANIGANLGARNSLDRERKEEMERLGLSKDMLDMAQDIGLALEQSNEGLQAAQESYDTQRRFAKRLDEDVTELYEKAKRALSEKNEELARKLLLERTEIQDKLKKVLINCSEDKKRVERMQENIAQLERKALEIDSLLRRSVTTKTLQDSSELGLSLTPEDPLLKKFKDLGID
jgi:DNA repair exonuclease SbcCD ATPase subunit